TIGQARRGVDGGSLFQDRALLREHRYRGILWSNAALGGGAVPDDLARPGRSDDAWVSSQPKLRAGRRARVPVFRAWPPGMAPRPAGGAPDRAGAAWARGVG